MQAKYFDIVGKQLSRLYNHQAIGEDVFLEQYTLPGSCKKRLTKDG
jgi:hypothetical protein